MADDGNQIGQVSIGVVAKGVAETNKQVDSVVEHAKKAQDAVSSITGPGMDSASLQKFMVKTAGHPANGTHTYDVASGPYDVIQPKAANSKDVVTAWASNVNIGKPAEDAKKLADGLKDASNAAGGMGRNLSKATSTVSALAGSQGFGPIPGILVRISGLLGPIGLAITASVGSVALLVTKWIEARNATREANEEIVRIRDSFKGFTEDLVNPISAFEKTLKSVTETANIAKEKLFEEFKKSSESTFQDAGVAYEKYWNERNRIDSVAEKTARDLMAQRGQARIQESVKSDEKAMASRAEKIDKMVGHERDAETSLAKEIADIKKQSAMEGVSPSEVAQIEGDMAMDAIEERLIGARGIEKQQLEELQEATRAFYEKKIQTANIAARKIADDEAEVERKKEESIQHERESIWRASNDRISSAWQQQQVQTQREMLEQLKIIASTAGSRL